MDGRKGIHAHALMTRARRWLISRVARTRHVRERANRFVPQAQFLHSAGLTLGSRYGRWNFSIHAYACTARARRWSKALDARVRVYCAHA